MTPRRLLIVTLLVAAIAVGALFLTFRLFPPPTQTPSAGEPDAAEPTAQISSTTPLLHPASVLDPALLPDGKTVRAYERISGHVVDLALQEPSSPSVISSADIPGLIRIWWSPDRRSVITLRAIESGPVWTLFHYDTGAAQLLDPSTVDVAFAPDSNRFAYVLPSGTSSVLFTANRDGADVRRAATLDSDRPLIWWTATGTILAAERPTGLLPSRIWNVDLARGRATLLSNTLFGLDVLSSPDGSRLLLSLTQDNGRTVRLAFSDASLKNSVVTEIETFAQKCAWLNANATVLCAVPQELRVPSTSVLPDAYEQGLISTHDRFAVINAQTGAVERQLAADVIADAANLLVPANRSGFVFLDRATGLLYLRRGTF